MEAQSNSFLRSDLPEDMDSQEGVFFYNEDIEYQHPSESEIAICISEVLQDHNKTLGTISIIFCSDDYLLEMNKEYLDHDYFTDILTFPMEEEPLSGDLVISIDRIIDNSKQLKTPFLNELNRVIIHGVLHLVGYDDHIDLQKQEMRKKEDHYLQKLKA